MSVLDWAKREVEIACRKENPNRKEGEWDYGCACYESALKAFESLCGDGHSGFSIKMTQAILNRMIDGQPLTPIEDTVGIFYALTEENGEQKRVEINRYFREQREGEESVYRGWIEITAEEYVNRKILNCERFESLAK